MNTKRKCIFNEELQRKYPCFKVTQSKHEAHCTTCGTTVSIANKGKFDLQQHLESKKHKTTIQAGECSKPLMSYLMVKKISFVRKSFRS